MRQISLYRSPSAAQTLAARYAEVLGRWPLPYRSLTVSTPFGDTHALIWGNTSNPPLVLLHGSAANSLRWRHLAAELARSFHVYALDIIGQPGRSAPVRPDPSGPGYGAWLIACLDGLGLGETALAGISLGGWVALKAAVAAPDRIGHLALLAPAGIVRPRIAPVAAALAPVYLNRRQGTASFIRSMACRPLDEDFHNSIIVTYSSMRLALPVIPTRIGDDHLKRLEMPTFLVIGERDLFFSPSAVVARLTWLLPCIRAEIVPDAGHMIPDDAPNAVLGGLRWLTSQE